MLYYLTVSKYSELAAIFEEQTIKGYENAIPLDVIHKYLDMTIDRHQWMNLAIKRFKLKKGRDYVHYTRSSMCDKFLATVNPRAKHFYFVSRRTAQLLCARNNKRAARDAFLYFKDIHSYALHGERRRVEAACKRRIEAELIDAVHNHTKGNSRDVINEVKHVAKLVTAARLENFQAKDALNEHYESHGVLYPSEMKAVRDLQLANAEMIVEGKLTRAARYKALGARLKIKHANEIKKTSAFLYKIKA